MPVTRVVKLNGVPVTVALEGSGPKLLLLHDEMGPISQGKFWDELCKHWSVVAPTHPGFALTEPVSGVDTVADLAYLYLSLIESLKLKNATILGFGLGGWIAADLAVKSTANLDRLVLSDAFGIKINDRETRDIVDIFGVSQSDLERLSYFDPSVARSNYAEFSDEEVLAVAKNREASARYGWSPYMHNPKLKKRLSRINVPTLVLWGDGDQIVSPQYGQAYADAIPGAKFALIERAGHFPHIEQPEVVSKKLFEFYAEGRAATALHKAN